MALLGNMGGLRLKREPSEPVNVTFADLVPAVNSIELAASAIWPGDSITIRSNTGLPLFGTNGVPLCPTGMGVFPGSGRYQAPSWASVSGPLPVTPPGSGPFPASATLYEDRVYAGVDQLGRISFYRTKAAGLNGETSNRLPLANVDFGVITITSNEPVWESLCGMARWSLELDSASVDTTGIGAKFGDTVKSYVTGGGSIDFDVDRRNDEGEVDAMILLRLLLMTERGCKASAEFMMVEDRKTTGFPKLLPGDLYYTADLLVVGTGATVAAGEYIQGSAKFVTTGEIKLKVGLSGEEVGPNNSLRITVAIDGVPYSLSVVTGLYTSLISVLEDQPWWGDETLAARINTAIASRDARWLMASNGGVSIYQAPVAAVDPRSPYPNLGPLLAWDTTIVGGAQGVAVYGTDGFASIIGTSRAVLSSAVVTYAVLTPTGV